MSRTAGLAVSLAMLAVARPLGATTATDICAASADPCVVSGDHAIASGSVLDFTTRALVLRRFATLSVGPGTLTIQAGSVELQPGAGLLAVSDTSAGVITVTTTGGVRIDADGSTKARIDVSGGTSAGEVHVNAGGDVEVDGTIDAAASTINGDGGTVEVVSSGRATIAGGVTAAGGGQGGGGSISFFTQGPITLSQPMDASGGELDGGDVDLESATSDVSVTAPINVSGGGLSGSGGTVTLTAGGKLVINGTVTGGSEGSTTEGGGTGGQITLSAQQSMSIGGQMSITGAAPDGEGGSVDADAGTDIVQTAPIFAGGVGLDTCGGDVTLTAGRNLTLGAIDVTGGSCGQGSILGLANGTTSVPAVLSADASSNGAAGTVTVIGQTLTTSSDLRASAGAGGGLIQLQACTLGVGASSQLTSQGAQGMNSLQASGHMTVAGTLLAGQANRLEYLGPPPVIAGASISPSPQIVQNPDLPPCTQQGAVCGNGAIETGETCDDGNTAACDGCSASCQVEGCGNGVVECAEQCDDGTRNGTPGDPCDATCHVAKTNVVFIAGGPANRGCLLEWAIQNPKVGVHRGFPVKEQTCIDGDPSCDADGADDGVCTFRVSACLNVRDTRLPTCPGNGVKVANIRRPSSLRPADEVEADAARTFVGALGDLGITVQSGGTILRGGAPDMQHDHCTPALEFRVPHARGHFGRRILTAGALDPTNHAMLSNRVRFECRPNFAVCGNGVLELGEECEDGNAVGCDGCSAACRREVCGNGVVDCGEQCDDGALNGTSSSACGTTCGVMPPALRVPGGGRPAADCPLEWSLATGHPALDRKGLPAVRQSCTDGDPACDFDPNPGICRFHLWACGGGDDARLACTGTAVAGVDLFQPSATQGGSVRQALLAALNGLPFPLGPGEVCSRRIDVDVPAGRRRFVIRAQARPVTGPRDRDVLQLLCSPPA